ncbi:MAG: hypothetical protein DWQ04_22280 [Chloroflexi bacterium]|nr:MAG: hypothetical protein DWQ04_22280 [Chloroflexota bacterium]
MPLTQLTFILILSSSLFWLGLYLIGRDFRSPMLWMAGASQLSYSINLVLNVLDKYAPSVSLARTLENWQIVFTLLPILCWIGLLVAVAPREHAWRRRMLRNRAVMHLLIVGTIFFAVGIALLQLGISTPVRLVVWQLLAVNLLVLGTAVSAIDATEKGEALWPHYLRSFDYSFFTALLFGGQIALVMRFATGINFAMLILLFATIGTAIIVQTFSSRFTTWADEIAFFAFPSRRQERALLRASADAVARVDEGVDLIGLASDEFARLTRKALSEMGNLPKLAASPLTQLPLVSAHLHEQGIQADTLARATTLKQLLAESIGRLKPDGERPFGTTDAWRHYNALYFPYVKGIRPYRRHIDTEHLDTPSRDALNWFRTEVPLRTLYNWQTAAARLIARDLRERSLSVNGNR